MLTYRIFRNIPIIIKENIYKNNCEFVVGVNFNIYRTSIKRKEGIDNYIKNLLKRQLLIQCK